MEKQILNQFINNIPQFVWWKDRNSVFLGCNDNFAHTAGLKNKEQVIGKTDYDLWNRESADFFRKIDAEVMASGQPQLNFEEPLTLKSGETRWLSTSKLPLYNDTQEIIGTLGWYNDITVYKQMQIQIDDHNKTLVEYSFQLEQANRELELANIDLEKFTYAASHDLQQPIRTMKNFAKLLKQRESKKLDDTSKEFLDFIFNSANRMESLVKDVLTYARTGSKELIAESVDINKIVANKLTDLKQITESKAAIIQVNLPDVKIKCYSHLIGLVFYNLINNGIKFNTSSPPIIECNYTEKSDSWIFTIADNGIGVAPAYATKIFEPFKRFVDESFEGSGIGLSICKRVANLHNGDIWMEKNPTGGTIFKFSISKKLK